MDEIIDLENLTEEQMESLVEKARKKTKDKFQSAMYDFLCRWAYVQIGPYTEKQKMMQSILKRAGRQS